MLVALLGVLLLANGIGAFVFSFSGEPYGELGVPVAAISGVVGLGVLATGVGAFRHNAAGRVVGVIVGALLAIAGMAVGYTNYVSWNTANNPPPGVTFGVEQRTLDIIDVGIPVVCVAVGVFVVWALVARWDAGESGA